MEAGVEFGVRSMSKWLWSNFQVNKKPNKADQSLVEYSCLCPDYIALDKRKRNFGRE